MVKILQWLQYPIIMVIIVSLTISPSFRVSRSASCNSTPNLVKLGPECCSFDSMWWENSIIIYMYNQLKLCNNQLSKIKIWNNLLVIIFLINYMYNQKRKYIYLIHPMLQGLFHTTELQNFECLLQNFVHVILKR